MVKQTVSLKVRIKPSDSKDIESMFNSMNQYKNACNFVSQYIFDHDFPLNQNNLQKILYHYIRNQFGLKSQMAQSVFRTVVARYKSVQTQLRKNPMIVNDKGKKYIIKKDLTWLQKPIQFKRPQLDLVRNRDYTLKEDGTISLNTVNGRIIVDSIFKGFEHLLTPEWELGTAKLLRSGKYWFLHISTTIELPDVKRDQFQHVVGIDRGLRQIMTLYDEKGKTTFFNGDQIAKKRHHYKRLRAKLQAKGTKSAKRRLKAISNRENRWMEDVNHCLSKTLITTYGPNTLFVMEDLTGVTFDTVSHRKKDKRYEHHSWAHYSLQQKLDYKARLNHSQLLIVPAYYTSQRCPKCGRIHKENRDKTKHIYICDCCSYQSNDDRVAAMNIQELGKRYMSGEDKPSYVLNDTLIVIG